MNQLKQINGISCIYEIRNLINNNVYLGSTNNLMYRRNYHLNHLRKGNHTNRHLQAAWNKYGEKNFELDIITFCNPEELFIVEQKFLDEWNPEYNISKYAQVPTKRGDKLSPEHIKKISVSNTGKVRTEESKRKQSQSRMGITYSDETKKLWSRQRMGHERTAKLHAGLVSPDGKVFKDIFNMAKFCRENKLQRSKISDLELGRTPSHKGWTLLKDGL